MDSPSSDSGEGMSDSEWPHDLDDAARDLVAALRWQLFQVRLKTLDPEGLPARRAVWAARDRVFTLISGQPGGSPVVIARAIQLALAAVAGNNAPPPAIATPADPDLQADLDKSLNDSIKTWCLLDQPSFCDALTNYVTATSANLAEQIMLLTYFESILPVDPAADPAADLTNKPDLTPGDPAPVDVTDLVAVLSLVSTSANPLDVYASLRQLIIRGDEPSNAFTTQVALLALASLAPPVDP